MKRPAAQKSTEAYRRIVAKSKSPESGELKKGRPAKARSEKKTLERLYIQEGLSVRKIAEVLGCSKDIVYRALEEYRIKRRPGGNSKRGPDKKTRKKRRSKLEGYPLRELKRKIAIDGVVKVAEELGVARQTLWLYVKTRSRDKKKVQV